MAKHTPTCTLRPRWKSHKWTRLLLRVYRFHKLWLSDSAVIYFKEMKTSFALPGYFSPLPNQWSNRLRSSSGLYLFRYLLWMILRSYENPIYTPSSKTYVFSGSVCTWEKNRDDPMTNTSYKCPRYSIIHSHGAEVLVNYLLMNHCTY